MITVHLTEDEEKLLLTMVEDRIDDLHSEIIRTEDYEYKMMLKSRKAVLLKLRDALLQSENSTKASMVTP